MSRAPKNLSVIWSSFPSLFLTHGSLKRPKFFFKYDRHKSTTKFGIPFLVFYTSTLVFVLLKKNCLSSFLKKVTFLFLKSSLILFHILVPRIVKEFWQTGFVIRDKKKIVTLLTLRVSCEWTWAVFTKRLWIISGNLLLKSLCMTSASSINTRHLISKNLIFCANDWRERIFYSK